MNHHNKTDGNTSKSNVNSRQTNNKQDSTHHNSQSIPTKQTNTYRSCLKHHTNRPSEISTEPIGTGRVSFAHAISSDRKIIVPSQSQNDMNEKNHRSATFAKKAKELQLAELTYFKDHAQDKDLIDD